MTSINPSTVFKHCGDVRYRIIDEEALIIRQEAGEVLGLNEVGARLLDLVDAKNSVQRIVDLMAEEFDAEPSQLQQDVFAFLRELQEAGVIEAVESNK